MRPSSRWPKWPFSRDFYSAVASVLALMGLCFCAMANDRHVIKYASNPSYDSIPITPKTWEEVDLIYYSTISGHRYTNAIQLLRPIAWIHKRHMDIIGSKVTLSMPEFGIVNVMTTVKAIKPTRVDTRGVDWSKQNNAPVIGKFMRYVTNVRTYTFKDSLGHISHINATPNHPFYVKNKHGFVAIGNVSDDDTLVGGIGSGENHIDGAIHLVCAKGKHSHCGEAFMGNGLPVSVYNLEVYRRHVYRVGKRKFLVHNNCFKDELMANSSFKDDFSKGGGCFHIAGGCIAKYGYERPVSDYITAHEQDRSYLMRFTRWAFGSGFDELPRPTVFEKLGAKNISRTYFNDEIFSSDRLKSIASQLVNSEAGEVRAAFIEIPRHYIGVVGKNGRIILSDHAFSGKSWSLPTEIDYSQVVSKYWDYTGGDRIYSVTYMQGQPISPSVI